MVETGIKGRQDTTVTDSNIATNVGSGRVKVFATPMMIALMEKTAALSVEPHLEPGESTVGIHIDVTHCASTPLGMKVWAESEVVAVDRRKVTFKVKAFDECGLIGEGTHDRFIIGIDKFQAKAESKSSGTSSAESPGSRPANT